MSGFPNPLADLAQTLQPAAPAAPVTAAPQNPVEPAPQPGGRVRSLLSNFFQGAGGAMMKHVGLPTPQEQAQQAFQNQQTLRQTASLEELRQAQQQAAMGIEVTPEMASAVPLLGGLQGQRVPKMLLDALSKKQVADIGAGAKTEAATIAGDASKAGAQIGATSRENVAGINAQNKTPNEIGLIQKMLAGGPEGEQAKATLAQLQRDRVALASARGQAFGASRPGAYIDTEGNVIADYAGDAIAKGYTPAVQGAKAMSQQAQFGEVKSGSTQLRGAIQGLDRDFTPEQRVKLSLAMRAPDENSLHTVINSMLGTEQLTPAQQNFVISAAQMHERILSLRNIAGMGQGSDSTRQALQATIPNVNMADKAYGLKQLDAVDNQIDQLYRGVPKVKSFKGGASPEPQPPRPPHVPEGYIFRANGPKGRGWYKQ